MTLFDSLLDALRAACRYNHADQAAPVAVLWPDRDRVWEPLLPALREALPILTLGVYDSATRTGPAIWLRCMIARALPEADWTPEDVPILYLPGVSRTDFRRIEGAGSVVQLLAELQFRGVFWTQKNGKDWTVAAFLQSADGGLGVSVESDVGTREALKRSLSVLAYEPVESLRATRVVRESYLNSLLNPDPVRKLLLWMSSPNAQRQSATPQEWAAFCATCQTRYSFHPEQDGELAAAERLGQRQGAWLEVWQRFTEAPSRFPGLPDLLRRARPATIELFSEPSSWPQDNEAMEEELRNSLRALDGVDPIPARQALCAAEVRHGCRRGWVWAELGKAPLAGALMSLARLADATERPVSGATPVDMARVYAESGWRADWAALESLATGETVADQAALRAAVEALYRPWLQECAEAFQQLVCDHGLEPDHQVAPQTAGVGGCLLFVDALRFDVARQLADRLAQQGLDVGLDWGFAPLPGVTATAKPAVSPIASMLTAGPELMPAAAQAPIRPDTFRHLLGEAGYTVLDADAVGDLAGRAWCEAGRLDAIGHNEGWRLAKRIEGEIQTIMERVNALLEAGWQEIRIITDHGWLLLPGGLPKAELPEHLTEVRKGRCARLKPQAHVPQQTVPWRWDPLVAIAVAPGIGCYVAGREYEHGGLSLQECVAPLLTLRPGGAPNTARAVAIESVKWTRLRCVVKISGDITGISLDLRTRAADPKSSVIQAPKPFAVDTGLASVICPDDRLEGLAVLVAILDTTSDQVLAQTSTVVGG